MNWYRRIPDDAEGYAVGGGVVHHRYAEHAKGLARTRSLEGVVALGGVRPCVLCYPPRRKR